MSEAMLDSLGGFGVGRRRPRRRQALSRSRRDVPRRQPGSHGRLRGDPRGRRRADLTGGRMPRVVAVADLHGNLPPTCPTATCSRSPATSARSPTTRSPSRPLARGQLLPVARIALPHPEIVWIAGNHDFACQSEGWAAGGRGTYLLDSGTEAAGLSIHGTPWVPNLPRWAFYADDEDRRGAVRADPARSTSWSPTARRAGPATGSSADARSAAASWPTASRPSRRGSACSATSTRTTALGARRDDARQRRLRRRALRRPPRRRPASSSSATRAAYR